MKMERSKRTNEREDGERADEDSFDTINNFMKWISSILLQICMVNERVKSITIFKTIDANMEFYLFILFFW